MRALYDYDGSQGKLSLRADEELVLLDDSRRWWRVRNAHGVEGDVPSNYVELAGKDLYLHFHELAQAWVLSVELRGSPFYHI